MTFCKRELDGMLIIEPVETRLDFHNSEKFKRWAEARVAEGHKWIILDLSKIMYLDSTGLAAVIAVGRMVQDSGKLILSGLNAAVMKLFKLTKLTQIYDIYDTAEEAWREHAGYQYDFIPTINDVSVACFEQA